MTADKNLGLCIIEKAKYIELVYDHLKDRSTYQRISSTMADTTIYNA